MFNLLRKLSAIFRLKPVSEPVTIDVVETGFRFIRDGEVLYEIPWSDIDEIATYKDDLVGYDEVCLRFHSTSWDEWFWLGEESPMFKDLEKMIRDQFSGIPENWFHDVAFPAFETNYRMLWKKPNQE